MKPRDRCPKCLRRLYGQTPETHAITTCRIEEPKDTEQRRRTVKKNTQR